MGLGRRIDSILPKVSAPVTAVRALGLAPLAGRCDEDRANKLRLSPSRIDGLNGVVQPFDLRVIHRRGCG
jgi:hypothetical protein